MSKKGNRNYIKVGLKEYSTASPAQILHDSYYCCVFLKGLGQGLPSKLSELVRRHDKNGYYIASGVEAVRLGCISDDAFLKFMFNCAMEGRLYIDKDSVIKDVYNPAVCKQRRTDARTVLRQHMNKEWKIAS